MKKFISVLLIFALIVSTLVGFSACSDKKSIYDEIPDEMVSASGYKLAMVTDMGALKDKGFNQNTWEGVKKYGSDNNISYKYYIPGNTSTPTEADRVAAMNLAITNGAEVIIAPGYLQEDAIKIVARANPTVKFVFIDGWALSDDDGVLENVVGVCYQEEQAGYFAGYAVVMEGYTQLGYTGGGGGVTPSCNRFGYGFIQGAEDAAKVKNVDVSVKYSYKYGSSFAPSDELEAQIAGWYNNGTEVVFACGGSMFTSVVAAANSTRKGKIVGVDVDQSNDSDRVITSAVKGLRESVVLCLTKIYSNLWSELSAKTLTLGAADDATGLPTEKWSLKKFKLKDYQELLQKVKDGDVIIINTLPAVINQAWFNGLGLTKVTVSFET